MPLEALREDMPRDFLASLGLARLLDLAWPENKPRLAWDPLRGFPVVHLIRPLPSDWAATLVGEIKNLEMDATSPLFHGDIIKVDLRLFRQAIQNALDFSRSDSRLAELPGLMYAAYGGQFPDSKTGAMEPTQLSFANGQSGKSLLRDARELIRASDPQYLVDSLNGRADPSVGKSFRWTPQEFRAAAHRAHDPGASVKGDDTLDYPWFNLLAFFGMSCLPAAGNAHGCMTPGFVKDSSGWSFFWPIWDTPITITEATALCCHPPSFFRRLPGVHRVWQARRFVAEKSVYFSVATPA